MFAALLAGGNFHYQRLCLFRLAREETGEEFELDGAGKGSGAV